MIEALKEAKSVIGSINSGKENALTIGGETVFWQREEWVRWALDEVLPLIEQAIAEAEKQEPVAWRYSFTHSSAIGHGDYDIGPLVTDKKDVAFGVGCFNQEPLYTHPQPKREPLTPEQVRKALYTTNHADLTGVVRAIEAAHGIKENT